MTLEKRYTLSKKERLKSKKCIERLFLEGKSFSCTPIRVVFIKNDLLQLNQVAFSVSKKNFKLAVNRNRIKRLMREAYRLNKYSLDERRFQLMFIYSGREIKSFSIIESSILSILKKIKGITK